MADSPEYGQTSSAYPSLDYTTIMKAQRPMTPGPDGRQEPNPDSKQGRNQAQSNANEDGNELAKNLGLDQLAARKTGNKVLEDLSDFGEGPNARAVLDKLSQKVQDMSPEEQQKYLDAINNKLEAAGSQNRVGFSPITGKLDMHPASEDSAGPGGAPGTRDSQSNSDYEYWQKHQNPWDMDAWNKWNMMTPEQRQKAVAECVQQDFTTISHHNYMYP